MALCLILYDETKGELREDFNGFAEWQITTEEALAESLHGNVRISKMIGQYKLKIK